MVTKHDRIYYEEELRYLTKEGKVFAARHPDIAQYLGLEGLNPNLRDPHSERIIEAFAFLNGRLRRFIDNQFPELVHALFNLIYPSYLLPLPTKTLVQFTPQKSMIDKPVLLPRGTSLKTEPIGEEGQTYEFTTCHDVRVQPIDISRVFVDPDLRADFSLSIAMDLHQGSQAQNLEFDEIEFTIFGDPSECYEIYNHLSRRLKSIGVKGVQLPSNQLQIHWSGFDDDHNFHQSEDGHYSQLHLLRDYFDFPHRFYFFKIKGLQEALNPLVKELTSFQVDLVFSHPFGSGYQFSSDNFRNHCCVAQNMFMKACEPFKVTGKQMEYIVTPDVTQPDFEVHRIERVLASQAQSKNEVKPYYHFSQNTVKAAKRWFYTLRRDLAFEEGWDTFIRFIDLDEEGPDVLINQTISVNAWCTNRDRAQSMKVGQLNRATNSVPETISVRNVTQASKATWPKIHSRGDWDFISHLALNFTELSSVEGVKQLLTLYNIPGSESGIRRINGIREVNESKDYLIIAGQAVPGRRLQLECNESHFQHEGDLALFCRVFGRFLRAYCPINSFIKLVISTGDHGTTLTHVAAY